MSGGNIFQKNAEKYYLILYYIQNKLNTFIKTRYLNPMKKTLSILVFTFLLSSCNKDSLFSGKDQLPAETQSGENTAGCLINGEVFIPHQRGLLSSLFCDYDFLDGKYYFNLNFSDQRGGYVKTIAVQTRTIDLQIGEIYVLNKKTIDNGDFIGGGGVYDINLANIFYTNSIKTGELKITRLDYITGRRIISGTFWFDAVNASGETVEIRQGRFDIKL